MMIRGKIVEWQVWKMSQSAYIQLVKGSAASSVTLEDVMNVLEQYREQTSATGQQLDWNYAEMAFPYTIEQRSDQGASWLHLKGNHPDYKHILIGVGKATKAEENEDETEAEETAYIQIVLPSGATHGDKAKANELCRYFGRKLQAQVHLFNGRIMYFNPRK